MFQLNILDDGEIWKSQLPKLITDVNPANLNTIIVYRVYCTSYVGKI